ncbi:MAG: AsmA family protein, partial [Bacteroidales bacterium]|nr:AsmA family protein [Bacteroidales bacterium]
MKKTSKIIALTVAALVVIIVAAAVIIPIAFRDKIKDKVQEQISSMVNAEVKFTDYKLSLFKAFPNVAFSVYDLSVTGVDRFENDTLAYVKSCDLVFNLLSLFSDSGYEIKSINVNSPLVNALILADGVVNWDIMKAGEEVETEPGDVSGMKILLKEIIIHEGQINYSDLESDMSATLRGLESNISGDMTASRTNLLTDITCESLTFVMENVKYLSGATASLQGTIDTQTDSMIFRFKDNVLNINDLSMGFSGNVVWPEDDITTDLIFSTKEATFKSLLSLIPAVFMEGYEDLKTDGSFSLDGTVKGIY